MLLKILKIQRFPVGILRTNSYLISYNNKGIIVDPGGRNDKLDESIKKLNGIDYIILTHGHFDHILEVKRYQELTGAKVVIGYDEKDFPMDNSLNLCSEFYKKGINNFSADILVKDDDVLNFNDKEIKIISTPGHTIGSVCYCMDNIIFSGDTLFKGKVGRTDLVTGNRDNMLNSLRKLYRLNRDYLVYPGHGLTTSLYREKLLNTGLK